MALPDTSKDSVLASRQWYERIFEMYVADCFKGRTAARVSELADLMGTTRPAVSRLVLQLFGRSLREILRERQLEYAVYLLTTTPLSVVEVGHAAAFGDATTFFRVFRKHFGMTPHEYRANGTKRQ